MITALFGISALSILYMCLPAWIVLFALFGSLCCQIWVLISVPFGSLCSKSLCMRLAPSYGRKEVEGYVLEFRRAGEFKRRRWLVLPFNAPQKVSFLRRAGFRSLLSQVSHIIAINILIIIIILGRSKFLFFIRAAVIQGELIEVSYCVNAWVGLRRVDRRFRPVVPICLQCSCCF